MQFPHARLKSYHLAWLKDHPDRSPLWLLERLTDGFDVHHLDGDHSNDDPGNLVLIEGVDHMRLHGHGDLRRHLSERRAREAAQRMETGRAAYERRQAGERWRTISLAILGRADGQSILNQHAHNYAIANGLAWPVVLDLPHWTADPLCGRSANV